MDLAAKQSRAVQATKSLSGLILLAPVLAMLLFTRWSICPYRMKVLFCHYECIKFPQELLKHSSKNMHQVEMERKLYSWKDSWASLDCWSMSVKYYSTDVYQIILLLNPCWLSSTNEMFYFLIQFLQNFKWMFKKIIIVTASFVSLTDQQLILVWIIATSEGQYN